MIVRKATENNRTVDEEKAEYFAKFNIYTSMAHFVGKTLHIRPSEIMETWGVSELIVAYGQYMNEISYQNNIDWHSIYDEVKIRPQCPREYSVRFISVDEMREYGKRQS